MNTIQYLNNADKMVTEGMKNMQREADQVRMLRKAGRSNSGERMAVAFGNTLIRLGERLQRKRSQSPQACQTTGGKYAV